MIKKKFFLVLTILLFASTPETESNGGTLQSIKKYFLNYRLGIDVTSETNITDVSYKYDSGVPLDPARCENKGSGTFLCSGHAENPAHVSAGIFVEQPFERKGFWHFDFDFAFAIRHAEIEKQTFTNDTDVAPSGYAGPPLRRFGYSLVGVNTLSYVEFGIAPEKYYPDLLFDFGMGLQTLWGKIYLNDYTFKQPLINFLAYGEINLVFIRWGKAGYAGFYAAAEAGSAGAGGIEIDGMSEFSFSFVRKDFGFLIVTNLPEKFL